MEMDSKLENLWQIFFKGRFTRYNFVGCDKLTTSLGHESFRLKADLLGTTLSHAIYLQQVQDMSCFV